MLAMFRLALSGLLVLGPLCAQEGACDAERVLAVLTANDPVRDGKGSQALLGPDTQLDAAIVALARSPKTERVVRLRALRLARCLRLAERLRADRQPPDVDWWLALDEISRELPEPLRTLLLSRSGQDPKALAAAQQELAAASAIAERFCREWNETRMLDDSHAEQNRAYDALQAQITNAGNAAVPKLLSILVVPPEVAFAQSDKAKGISARQQVRAMHALASFVRAKAATPFLVMHAAGPSLTQSSLAGQSLQVLNSANFGAAFLVVGDDEAIMTWWREHQSQHQVVLDYLVQHVVRLAEDDYKGSGASVSVGLWSAVGRLERALGTAAEPASDAGVEVLCARLAEVQFECLQRGLR